MGRCLLYQSSAIEINVMWQIIVNFSSAERCPGTVVEFLKTPNSLHLIWKICKIYVVTRVSLYVRMSMRNERIEGYINLVDANKSWLMAFQTFNGPINKLDKGVALPCPMLSKCFSPDTSSVDGITVNKCVTLASNYKSPNKACLTLMPVLFNHCYFWPVMSC